MKWPEARKCSPNCRVIAFDKKCDCGAYEYNLGIIACKEAYNQGHGAEADKIASVLTHYREIPHSIQEVAEAIALALTSPEGKGSQ